MKKYLLDTHALIWFIEGNEQLSKHAKNIMLHNAEHCQISIISLWEISIKIGIKKLNTKHSLQEFVKLTEEFWKINNVISNQSVFLYKKLPLFHRDPFDRMLIAQAKAENLCIITKDANFSKYDVDILW